MFCGPHFEHISVDFSNVVLQVCSIILRKKGLKYHEETLLHIQTYYSKQYNTSETQDSGCLLTRSIINYKYDFEMRKKKRSEMANFYMTWWCVCVCTYDFLCILCLATFSANLWIANWAIQKGWMKMKLRFLRYSVKSDAKKNQQLRIIRYIVLISMVILDRT